MEIISGMWCGACESSISDLNAYLIKQDLWDSSPSPAAHADMHTRITIKMHISVELLVIDTLILHISSSNTLYPDIKV